MARFGSLTPRPRPTIALLVALLVVVVIAVTTIFAGGGFPWAATSHALRAPVRVQTLTSAHLACPVDPYFSPDGAHISLLGALDRCAGDSRSTPEQTSWALAIFAAPSGALERVIPLDPLLAADGGRSASTTRYASLGWSPDGRRLIVVYTTFSARGGVQPDSIEDSGLLLVSVASGQAQVIRGDSGFFSALTGTSAGYPIWNIADGATISGYLPEPGLAYAWDQEGVPGAVAPLRGTLTELPRIAGPRYPIGDPAGGSRFTVWQPGLLVGGRSAGGGLTQSLFVALFPAWSEDGMWVTVILAEVGLTGRVESDQQAATTTNAPPIAPYPVTPHLGAAPSRDVALEAVRRQVGESGWAVVAWNPTGARLASIACFAASGPQLELRDTGSGSLLGSAALGLPAGDSGCQQFGDADSVGAYPHVPLALRWSPDGAHLLMSDRDASLITLWTVNDAQAQG
jgi:hypothetical protein